MNQYRNLDMLKSGQTIKEAVQSKGYTVREIQKILQFECTNSIYRWYKGIILPSVNNLYVLSKVLEVHMEDLLVEKERN